MGIKRVVWQTSANRAGFAERSDKHRSLRFADYRFFSVGRGLAPAVNPVKF